MGESSKIEWCDHTFNPWIGCTEVGPACDHCYARVMMADRYGRVTWGAGEDRIRTSEANWKQPFKWNRDAAAAGRPARVFCLSLGDIWDNEVDPRWRRDAFGVMEHTPNLIWLLLSKRIGNAIKMCDPDRGNPLLPRNAALGATMVNQDEWDRDAPKLREAARVLEPLFTFASVEPMLGPINVHDPVCREIGSSSQCPACLGGLPEWVIVGGESGPNARPMRPDWARDLRDQCAAAGVAYFFKQWGEWAPGENASRLPTRTEKTADWFADRWHFGSLTPQASSEQHIDDEPDLYRLGKKAAGRLLDGRAHDEMPAVRP